MNEYEYCKAGKKIKIFLEHGQKLSPKFTNILSFVRKIPKYPFISRAASKIAHTGSRTRT